MHLLYNSGMTIIYEDDIYPEDLLNNANINKFKDKTIREILENRPDPKKFISVFNRSNKYCLSDEIGVVRKHLGGFINGWQRN